MWSFLSSLSTFQGLSTVRQESEHHSFFYQTKFHCRDISQLCLCILWLTDTGLPFTSGPPEITLGVSSVLLGIYLWVELLGSMATLHFRLTLGLFSKVAKSFDHSTRNAWSPHFPTFLPVFAVFHCLGAGHLSAGEACRVLVVATLVRFIPLRNVYLNLTPIVNVFTFLLWSSLHIWV